MATVAEKSLDILRATITGFLAGDAVRIVLFGSRARGEASAVSDVDIGIVPLKDADLVSLRNKLSLLRESIENMNVPYKVELVDFSGVSDDFRRNALKDAVSWKD